MPRSRKGAIKPVNPVFYIYCEGEKTEPFYINGYLSQHCAGLKTIRVVPTIKNTPVQLVDVALEKKRSKDVTADDVFWVVYDRESTALHDAKYHQQAYDKALANGINLAITNVCFEIWILLHFQLVTAEHSDYEDVRKNSSLRAHLKKLGVDDYDKSCAELYSLISNKIEVARASALKMNSQTLAAAPRGVQRPYLLNPYTQVHELLDAIDAFYSQFKKF